MSFSQQQHLPQTQQQSHSPLIPPHPLSLSLQQLADLPAPQRLSLYLQTFTQPTPIYLRLFPNFRISNLAPSLQEAFSLFANPFDSNTHTLAQEASQIFHADNEFLFPISSIQSLTSYPWSAFLTRVAILFNPPHSPRGDPAELYPLLTALPALRQLQLVFQDYRSKGRGPLLWLRPCIPFILQVKDEGRVELKLLLLKATCLIEGVALDGTAKQENLDLDQDLDLSMLEDVTVYLEPLSNEQEKIVDEAKRRIEMYRGPVSSCVSMLVESGWGWDESEKVVGEWMERNLVKEWIKEARKEGFERVDERDIEMIL